MDALFDDIVEIISLVDFENIGYVLPENVSGILAASSLSHLPHNADHVVEQTGAFISEAFPLSGNGNAHARPSATDDIHGLDLVSVDLLNIAKVRDVGESLLQYPTGERLDLSIPDRLDPAQESRQLE